MKNLLASIVLIFSASCLASSTNTQDAMKTMLDVSRTEGICSVFYALAQYQDEKGTEETKKFISDFLQSRLQAGGFTHEGFVEACKTAIKFRSKIDAAQKN